MEAVKEEKKIDLSKLKEKLEMLTGFDIEAAEAEERAARNMAPDVSFSKRYQARLAAKALGCTVDDVRALKANEYNVATALVSDFLFGSLAAEAAALPTNTGK